MNDSTPTSPASSQQENEIILYQPDSTVKLEVRLENETVWLTQQQIADLFGTKRPAITKHLANIYKSGELDEISTCSILEHMGNDGNQWEGAGVVRISSSAVIAMGIAGMPRMSRTSANAEKCAG